MNSTQMSFDSSIERIVRGFEALDKDNMGKILLARNISIRAIIVTYIVYAFLFDTIVTKSILIASGIVYVLTQSYVTYKLLSDAGYRLKDWVFLFKKQSRFSKFFIIVGLGLIFVMVWQLFFISTNVRETATFIIIFITFVSTSLTDVLVKPFLQYKLYEKYKQSPEQQELIDSDSEATKQHRYRQMAMDVLSDEKSDSKFTISQDTAPQANQNTSQEQADTEKIRQQALQKLREVNDKNSGDVTLALTPKEIDALTDEELSALIPDKSPIQREKETHRYPWETNRK